MESIFEALLENLGAVIIIGGIVLSLLGRASRSRTGQPGRMRPSRDPSARRQNPMMPPFGGPGTYEPHPRPQPDVFRERGRQAQPQHEQMRPNAAPPVSADRSDFGAPTELRPSLWIDEHEHDARPEEPLRSPLPPADRTGTVTAVDVSRKREEPVLSSDEAVRGMIWAEVLGPPRAKRPYRPGNR
jgi:hypothetical protein